MNEIEELEELEDIGSIFGPGVDNFMVEWSRDVKLYLYAIAKTLYFNAPFYTMNIFKWVKCAAVDAPCRIILDIDIEYIAIKRQKWLKRKRWLEENNADLSKTNNEEKINKED